MGFSVGFRTTEPISPALQREIIDAAMDLIHGRTWLSCEPPLLSNDDGHLYGSCKPNFFPAPEDVASARSEGLPDGTLRDALDVLCELSRRFDIDWEIEHDHSDGPLGDIRAGICDDVVRTQLEALSDVADELGELGGFGINPDDL